MENRNALFHILDGHLLDDMQPSLYLKRAVFMPAFHVYPFSLLLRLKDTPQSKKFHPEGSAWNHTLLVVDEAARRKAQSSDMRAFMWAALLHDIGKYDTTRYRRGRITAYDHDKTGAALARRFLDAFDCDASFTHHVVSLVRWHMQLLYVLKDLPFADIPAMLRDANPNDVALLCLCDRLGRMGSDLHKEQQNHGAFLHRIQALEPPAHTSDPHAAPTP